MLLSDALADVKQNIAAFYNEDVAALAAPDQRGGSG